MEPEALRGEVLSGTGTGNQHRRLRPHSQEGFLLTTKKRPGPPLLTNPPMDVPDGAVDQSAAVPIAQVQTPVYPGAQPLPAGILPRRDGRVKFGAVQESENFLGADRGMQEAHLRS